ncbi:MAG: methylenetetrahydrofolate reductase [Fidelibacterota bacterium]
MRVIDYLEKSNKTLFSYEIIPPKRGGRIESVFTIIEQLMPFDPPFIDLTSRSAEVSYDELDNGMIKKTVKRKRPGTIGLSAAIKNRFNVETVPHLLCHGFTREETEDALIELNYLGIHNVFAVRGDFLRKPQQSRGRTHNRYAIDLVNQINRMNEGKYLEELFDAHPTNFSIGVGGYPEKHFEAPNLEVDIAYLKEKVDAGADYIVTQMHYDNNKYFAFHKACREAGITVPIIPGIKILNRKSHLVTIPRNFHVDIPRELVKMVTDCSDEDVPRQGIKWALNQCQELMDFGVPCIHFYIMSSAKEATQVVAQLK